MLAKILYTVYSINKGSVMMLVALIHKKNDFKSIYFMPDIGNANEALMLRLIKMKAFL